MRRSPLTDRPDPLSDAAKRRYLELIEKRSELRKILAAVEAELDPIEAAFKIRLASRESPRGLLADQPEPAPGDKRFTVPDLCRRFSRGQQTIYRWVRSGKLQPLPGVGRPYLFDLEAVERFESGWKRRRT